MLENGDTVPHHYDVGRQDAATASVELRRRRWRRLVTAGLEGACGDRAARVLSAAMIFRGKPDFPTERGDLEAFLRTELMAAAAAVVGHDKATELVAELSTSIDEATGVARVSLTQRRVRRSKRSSEAPTAEQYLEFVEKNEPVIAEIPPRNRPRGSFQRLRAADAGERCPVMILSASGYAARAVELEHAAQVEVIHHDDASLFEQDFRALIDRNPIVVIDARNRYRDFCRGFVKRCDPLIRCLLWGFGTDAAVGENMVPSVASLTPEDLSMIVGRFLKTRC